MSILRVCHNKNYTVINNTITRDKRLSWKAKGIWLYAFSRPDDWSFHIDDLINQSTDGRESVRAGIKELEEAGYLVKVQTRDKEGKLGASDWTFFEIPQELKKLVPQTENPSTVNRPLLSTEEQPSTERLKQQQPVKLKPSAVVVKFSSPIEERLASLGVKLSERKKWNHTQKDIELALAATDEQPRESPLRFFRAALKEKWQPTDKILSLPEVIRSYFKHGKVYNGADCWIDADGIGFTRGMKHISVKFTEFGFNTKVKKMLEQFGISMPPNF